MKRLILIVTIVLFLSSCSSLSFFEKPADTTRRVPSVPSKASEQIEHTYVG
jgi:PBP1b-binding outer membrane lipoprotein LpoB